MNTAPQPLDPHCKTPPARQRLVIVTGPSGAGRGTAIHILEDLGFEAIDNIPMSMLRRLVDASNSDRPMALGVDVRNRDFSVERLQTLVDWLDRREDLALQLLFLDCNEDVLVRRYSETRRRHPLVPDAPAITGIRQEIALLAPVRDRADILLDTSETSPHDLKAALSEWFSDGQVAGMGVTLQSFSYKRGVPKGIDMMFDCRFLRNPHWEPVLRNMTGLDAPVQAHVAEDARFALFVDRVRALILDLLPAFRDEGKSHLSIGFGCTGGQHRSVVVTETLARGLAEAGWQVSKRHGEQERWGRGTAERDKHT
jgi:UPF0042 nucleotide-binding protein